MCLFGVWNILSLKPLRTRHIGKALTTGHSFPLYKRNLYLKRKFTLIKGNTLCKMSPSPTSFTPPHLNEKPKIPFSLFSLSWCINPNSNYLFGLLITGYSHIYVHYIHVSKLLFFFLLFICLCPVLFIGY